jgi:hypothetical protein
MADINPFSPIGSSTTLQANVNLPSILIQLLIDVKSSA